MPLLTEEVEVGSQTGTARLLTDHFRCPAGLAAFEASSDLSPLPGYFQFGADTVCYGKCSSGATAAAVTDSLHDTREHVKVCGASIRLPFDPVEVIKNLHFERYSSQSARGGMEMSASKLIRKAYYLFRPLMPVALRKHLQQFYFRKWSNIRFPNWPVDFSVENLLEQLLMISMKAQGVQSVPFIWFWPDGWPSCATVTHDVETAAGRDFCRQLMDLNDSFGIKSAFQVVPVRRYPVPEEYLESIRERGFELNVHDFNHDGHLLDHQDEFLRRAKHINDYGQKFGAQGFRSAMLHRNLDWYDALEFSYDMSVPNVAHLDPQRGGCCTVFPFFNGSLLELPVTMTQDYTLFNILNDYSIDLWKEQGALIRQRHGLMQVIVHPDYIIEKEAQEVYAKLLGHLADLRSSGDTWIALPGEVASWWRTRSELRLVGERGAPRIEGEGKHRARIAYATILDDKLVYDFDGCQDLAVRAVS